MRLSFFKNTLLITVLVLISCVNRSNSNSKDGEVEIVADVIRDRPHIVEGAARFDQYLPTLSSKKVGVVSNQTSIVFNESFIYEFDGFNGSDSLFAVKRDFTHLVDTLLSQKVDIRKVFAPEHGFRGRADAGELVKDGMDTKTGLPIISLYGKNKKPSESQMEGLDVVVFDIQDVGVRFYTYVSTMHYMMEACAEAGIPFIVLDRPNPNGHYIDGPIMEKKHTSFLGLHPVPLVHGMTIGEYAKMINGESWLANGMKCDLTVIEMENYSHETFYSVPVRPSPNLPNDVAINLYPSLGLLEGTNLNAGRGTEMQFQTFGSPHLPIEYYPFQYTPQPNFGAKYPKHKGTQCNGLDLRETPRMSRLDLTWIIEAYKNHSDKENFFNTKNFTAHAGTEVLQQQIMQGYTHKDIRNTWIKPLMEYDAMRQRYLLYK